MAGKKSKNSNKQKKSMAQKGTQAKKPKSKIRQEPRQTAVAAAYSTPSIGKSPKVKSDAFSSIIERTELIGTLVGSTQFALQKFVINPGDPNTFPWLNYSAQNWEFYEFMYCEIIFRTRVGADTVGSVILAPDYDASDPAPLDEVSACSYTGFTEDVCWKDQSLKLDPRLMKSLCDRHIVRNASTPVGLSNADTRQHDVANVFACVIGMVTGASVGKLLVRYKVRLYSPQTAHPSSIVGGKVTGVNTLTAANPFGVAPTVDTENKGFTVGQSNPSYLIFRDAGDYLVDMSLGGTGVTAAGNPLISAGAGSTSSLIGSVNAAGTLAIIRFVLTVTTPGTQIQWQNVAATTVTGSNAFAARGPNGSFV